MSQDDFPSRVRAERKNRGWTQQELADRASVSLRMLQMFETRKSSGTPENRRAILTAVGIDPDGNDIAADTRSSWPPDVQVFLDVMGAYLVTLPEAQRLDAIHDLTRQIFESRR